MASPYQTNSPEAGGVEAQAGGDVSLITYVSPEDRLPDGWLPASAKRRSADEAYHLQRYWELHYSIRKPEHRRESEPAIHRKVSNATAAFLRQHNVERSYQKNSRDGLNITPPQGWRSHLRTQLQRSWPDHFKFRAPRPTKTRERLFIKSAQHCRNLCQEFGILLRILVKVLWCVFRRPILIVILLLVVMEIIALCYTLTSYTFLNTFCEMKHPFIRDWVCSDYDAALSYKQQARNATEFGDNFGSMFEADNIGVTISMPHLLSKGQSEFRFLRANLRRAKLSASDENFFREKLTQSIDISRNTIGFSQRTFNHLHGSVDRIVSGTPRLIRRLNDTGFTPIDSVVSLSPVDGLLASSMDWLGSHHLVYLPVGIEPFRERPNTPYEEGIRRIRIFISEIRERLLTDKVAIVDLQDRLSSLINLSDELIAESVRCAGDEAIAKVTRGHRSWYSFLKMIGEPDLQDYITENRLLALESMQPVYRRQIQYLGTASTDLGYELQACENIEEALLQEEAAVRQGISPSSWVWEQPHILVKGANKLSEELKRWDTETEDFHQQIMKQLG